jgi:Domain of unknown function (DUF4351)
LTPTLSAPILEGFGAQLDLENWGEGVYLMPAHLKTGIIVLHQLPKTPETLWLRILGKERVQEQAIQEVAALPAQHPQRDNVLDLLGNLKVILEARANIEPEEQELIMQLSPLYLEKIQAAELVGEQRGEVKGKAEGNTQGRVEEARGLVIRQLTRKLGTAGSPLLEKIQALPLEQVELLGADLLDFTSIDNLEQWLA